MNTVPIPPKLTAVPEIRRRAREHVENGAVIEGYRADREAVVEMLNVALASETVCVLRYRRHYFMAQGLESKAVAAEFLQHSTEEQGHADQIAHRITQLNGEPDFNPDGMLARSNTEYVEGRSLLEMIRENLVAERVAIETYSEIIRYLGDYDTTTKHMLVGILATEEEHAVEMSDLLARHGSRARTQ